MEQGLEISDMPALTREFHADRRGLERLFDIDLNRCVSTHSLNDPDAALEYARTYAIEFYDLYYNFYSQFPDYQRHWQPASAAFALQRVLHRLNNYFAIQDYLDNSHVARIRRTISDHADGTVRNPDSNVASDAVPADSISAQLAELFEESRLTREYVAEQIGIDKRNVFRHLRGIVPRPRQIAAYETFFTERLNRQIRLKTS
jgi:hypothetical protein